MLSHEDLWIKISDDFHAEINPILEQLISTSKQSYWFDKKGIPGKFFIINNVLLSLNGTELNIYSLTRLLNCLEAYKFRVRSYLERHNIATCFVYFAVEINISIKDYFLALSDYNTSVVSLSESTTKYMNSMDIIGFPNNCSYKLTAKISNKEILIDKNIGPIHQIEIERGNRIGNSKRTKEEQIEIENQLYGHVPELRIIMDTMFLEEFTEFAKKIHHKNLVLFEDFENNIVLCKSILDKVRKDSTNEILPEIERIYSVLKNGYIEEPFERFREIFHADYSGDKIIWIKYGYELKYFIDKLKVKMKLPFEINKWAVARFQMNPPIKRFSNYLSKQITHKEYTMLNSGNRKKHPLFILFKE